MFGDRFNRSVLVAKESYAVLRGNPSLAIFPLLSGIAAIAVSAPFLVMLFLATAGRQHHDQVFGPVQYALTALMYFVNYLVIVFFNSALVACANENLQGRATTVSFGFHAAMARLPQIVGWALIASTVGMILKTISERSGIIGSIVTSLIGLVWNLAVFFVVPCLVLDREGPVQSVKTSAGMIKQTWGERVMLGIGLGTVLGLLSLVAILPIVLAIVLAVNSMFVLAGLLAVCGIAMLLALSVTGSAMTAIFQTALYVYCRTGAVPAGFDPLTLQNAFAPKPERRLFGR